MSKFKLIRRSSARENDHSIWRAADGRFVVSDQSGDTPEDTDDGPIYIDSDRGFIGQTRSGGQIVAAFTEDGKSTQITTSPRTVSRLLDLGAIRNCPYRSE